MRKLITITFFLVVVLIKLQGQPGAPTVGTITQPTCSVPTGSVVLTDLPDESWTITPGPIPGSGTNWTVTGLTAGTYNFIVTTTADPTNPSDPSDDVVINEEPSAPASATASTTIQPTCALATGTIVVTDPTGAYEYNIDGGSFQPSATFTGVAPGDHYVLVRSATDNTCISNSTLVTVNDPPTPPPAPEASTTVHPTCAVGTGTIVVSAPLGSEYEYNLDGDSYQTSSTFNGVPPGDHNIRVRRTADECISDATSVTVNNQPSAPAAPAVSTTQPTCAVATGTIEVTAPTGAYEYNIDGGTYQSSTTFAGVSPGSHNILVRRTGDNTCISTATAVTVNAQPSAPAPATASTTIQPTCALATGTIVVTAPTGSYQYNIDGGTYQSSTTFAGISPGSHNILVRRTGDNTCISTATAVTVNAQPSAPAPATASTTIQPTCAVATGTIVVTAPTGAYEYNIDGGTYQSSTTFAGISPGSHNILVRRTGDNTCISTATTVTVNAQPSAPAAATASTTIQPTCALATGTIVVTAPTGAYEYNMDGGTYQSSTTFAGISPGSHNILVRRTGDNACISTATAVTVNAQPSTPASATVTTTHPTCAVTTGTIVVTAPTGSYQYNIDGGTYQSSTTFAGISPGSHNILVRRTGDNTCISTATAVTVNAQPSAPAAATASTTVQPTCALPTGTIVVTAPTGAYEYNIDGGTYQSSTTFAGISPGSHNILVRRTGDNTCISTATTVTVNAQPSAPAAATASTTIQPTCALATGTIVVTAPTGAYEYNIDGGTYQSSTTFAGISPGSHNILVRRTGDNACISTATAVTVNAQPSTPASATVTTTHPTCAVATGTIVVTSPTGAYEYNIDGGTYQSSVTFAGISPGSHNILVRRTGDNTCISTATAVTVNAQPSSPAAATASTTVQPTCALATGTIVVTDPTGAYEYNIDGGTYQSSTTFAGISPGSHNILVRRTGDNTCISTATAVSVNDQPSAPAAATASTTIQPTCTVATGTIVVTAPTGAYEYNIDGGTFQASTTFAGMSAGSHNILVRRTVDNTCISVPTSVTVNAQPITPTAPAIGTITQPNCTTATGSVALNGLPSSGTWTLTRNPDAVTTTGTGASTTISGLAANTYTFTVNSESGCTSDASGNVVINTQPLTPTAPVVGTITHPTCTVATGSVILDGLPAAGIWTLTRTPGAATTSGTGTTTTIAGLAAGTYTYIVTNASGCPSTASANVVINAQPSTPTAPTIGTITHPTCAIATGSAILNGLPATGTWILTRTPGATTSTGTGISTTLSGIPAGTFTFTVTNAVGCTSPASGNAVINAQPPTPAAPVIGTITQPTLSVPTGSVVLNGLPATGAWTLTRTPGGAITTGTGSGTTISSLAPGTYTFTVTNSYGCTSLASAVAGLFTLKLYGPDQKLLNSNDIIKLDNSDAGSFSIGVESNTEWTVSDNSLWLKAVKESGSPKITVSYLENISSKDKLAAVRVSYTSNPDFVINIQQKARVSHLNNSKFENVKIYPNPANDIVYLTFGKEEFEKVQVSITNIQGLKVSTEEYKDISPDQIIGLKISQLPVGQYLINIGDGIQSKSFHLIKY